MNRENCIILFKCLLIIFLVFFLFASCSKTIVSNGVKISGNIKAENIDIPVIKNIITGIDEEAPNELVTQNNITPMLSDTGIIILLTPNSNIDLLRLTAENNKHKSVYYPNFRPVKDFLGRDTGLGYYSFIYMENKSWVSNGNDWTFSLFENDNLIISGTFPLYETDNVLYYTDYNDSPFYKTNTKQVSRLNEYTYRFNPNKTDIIVVYKYKYQEETYYPICTFSVKKWSNKIKVEWLNESEDGYYCIKIYSTMNIPKEEKRQAVFDYYILE